MDGQKDFKQQMDAVFAHIIQGGTDWARNIDKWNWNPGVCLYGIMKAHQATGDAAYLRYLEGWFERNTPGRIYGSVNCVTPCNAALYLQRLGGGQAYTAVFDEYVDWCVNLSIKASNGGIAHVWNVGGVPDRVNQLWIDTLFMACIFLTDYALEARDEALLQSALEQVDIHLSCQFDRQENLFYHGYHTLRRCPLGQLWGRGNGWAVASLAELLEKLSARGHDASSYREIFTRAMERGYGLRTQGGMLRTLLTDPDAYAESTGTTLFGYAALKGYELGLLDERFLQWGREIGEGLEFTPEGVMRFASGGTDCQGREGYLGTQYLDTCFAAGTAMMFLSQLIRAGDKTG